MNSNQCTQVMLISIVGVSLIFLSWCQKQVIKQDTLLTNGENNVMYAGELTSVVESILTIAEEEVQKECQNTNQIDECIETYYVNLAHEINSYSNASWNQEVTSEVTKRLISLYESWIIEDKEGIIKEDKEKYIMKFFQHISSNLSWNVAYIKTFPVNILESINPKNAEFWDYRKVYSVTSGEKLPDHLSEFTSFPYIKISESSFSQFEKIFSLNTHYTWNLIGWSSMTDYQTIVAIKEYQWKYYFYLVVWGWAGSWEWVIYIYEFNKKSFIPIWFRYFVPEYDSPSENLFESQDIDFGTWTERIEAISLTISNHLLNLYYLFPLIEYQVEKNR